MQGFGLYEKKLFPFKKGGGFPPFLVGRRRDYSVSLYIVRTEIYGNKMYSGVESARSACGGTPLFIQRGELVKEVKEVQ
jgi:hypothetical protein